MVRASLMVLVVGVMSLWTAREGAASPGGAEAAPAPFVPPQPAATVPLKCLQKGMISYCIPNTTKYQVCSPTVKQVECPIDSYCKETVDAKGNTIAYCKFIG